MSGKWLVASPSCPHGNSPPLTKRAVAASWGVGARGGAIPHSKFKSRKVKFENRIWKLENRNL
jgi:hypothetical protein